MNKISITNIQKSLTPGIIKTLQIIYLAIIAGATIFFLVILFIYLNHQQQFEIDQQIIETINIMSIVHIFIFLSCLILSNIIPKTIISKIKVNSNNENVNADNLSDIANSYIAIIRRAKVIYIALLEAPAFLGLVICFIAITNDVIFQFTYYWLNLISYFIFLLLVAKDFPSKEKIINIFKTELNY